MDFFTKTITTLFLTIIALAIPVSAFDYQIINTNPAPIQAGDYADITIRIDTQGISAQQLNDFTLKIQETNSIKPVPGQERTFRALNPGQTITHTFRVFFAANIPTGEIPLTILLKQQRSTQELTQPIYISGAENKPELHIGQIRSTPDKLLQDTKSNTIEITLQNLGEKDAQLITATIIPDNNQIIKEAYSYSLTHSLASLEGGAQETLQFTLDIEPTALLTIPVELELRYRTRNDLDNSYTTTQEKIAFDIRLVSAPRYEIISMEPVNTIQGGTSNNQLQLTIKNTGEEEARSVRLRLYPDPALPFDFERTSIFVTANIKPGEQATTIIPFDVLNDAIIQEYTMNAQIESLVGSTRYSQDLRLTIPVEQEASSGLSLYLLAIILFSIILAAIIGFVYNRKKR